MAPKNRTELPLWNSLVRIPLAYRIQTLELKAQDKKRLGGFAFYWLRNIQDIYWSETTKTTMREPTYFNATPGNQIADTKTQAETRHRESANAMGKS